MKNTIERIQDSIDDIKTAINTKYLSNGEEAPIEDDTLLEEYALAIDNIKTETIDISQQIFVFYCWATNETDAKSKILPTITWNSITNKWSLECTPGEWSTSADEEELDPAIQTDAEKYLYAMFVSVNTDTNSSNISWPDPVRLTGKTGEKGEDGSEGRDGVVAGLTLHNIVNLYTVSDHVPNCTNIQYIKQDPTKFELFATDLIINSMRVLSSVSEDDDDGQWYSAYPSSNHTDKIWMIQVSFKSDNDNTEGKSPILLTQPVLVADAITNITAKYSYSNDTSDLNLWSDVPLSPTLQDKTCYVVYIISTKYGEIEQTKPGVYSQFPKSISDVTYEYGTSVSTAIIPNIWSTTYPDMTSDVIWIRRTEEFSDGKIQTVQYPIGLRGPSGIQFIASVESENDLSSISPIYDNNYIGKLGVRVGQNIYVWYGTEDPNLTGIVKKGNCYWLNIGPLSPIPDWNADETEDGYIKNRTHYDDLKTVTYSCQFERTSDDDSNWKYEIPNFSKFGNIIDVTTEGIFSTIDLIEEFDHNWFISGWDSFGNQLTMSINSNEITLSYNYDYSEGGSLSLDYLPTGYVQISFENFKQLDPKFVPQMIEITYADLKNLRDTNQLIPGMQYRIIDYETSVSIGDQMSAKHPFDLIVTADSTNTINCKAKAVHSVRDTSGYFTNSDLSKWDIWYTLDMSKYTDKIIYDWTWFKEEQSGIYIGDQQYDIDYTSEVSAVLAENLINSGITTDNFLNTSGNFYIAKPLNYYQYIYKIYDCNKLFVYDASMHAALFNQMVLSVGADADTIYLKDSNGDPIVKINYLASNHKIDNVKVCDHNNTLLSVRKVVPIDTLNFPKEFYVTDECVSALLNYINSNNSTWDGFKQQYPNWPRSFGYLYTIPNKKVAIPISQYDPDFIISMPGYFKKYDELKTGNIFKGTIYRMIDEFGNDCPYDFKNILLKKSNTYYYTFDKNLQDGSLDGPKCNNNKIESCLSGDIMTLPFINLIYSGKAIGNVFGKNSENITLTSYTYEPKHGSILNWTVGCNCTNINCKEIREDSSLVIGNNCSDITCNNFVIQTVIGNNCSDITFNQSVIYSIIGNNCSDITLEYADSVIIKDMCSNITITSLNVQKLIIEPQCRVMTLNIDFDDCLIESQCWNVKITGNSLHNCIIARQKLKTHTFNESKDGEIIK